MLFLITGVSYVHVCWQFDKTALDHAKNEGLHEIAQLIEVRFAAHSHVADIFILPTRLYQSACILCLGAMSLYRSLLVDASSRDAAIWEGSVSFHHPSPRLHFDCVPNLCVALSFVFFCLTAQSHVHAKAAAAQ